MITKVKISELEESQECKGAYIPASLADGRTVKLKADGVSAISKEVINLVYNARNGVDVSALEPGKYRLVAKRVLSTDPVLPTGSTAVLEVVDITGQTIESGNGTGAFLTGFCKINSDGKIVPDVAFNVLKFENNAWSEVNGGQEITLPITSDDVSYYETVLTDYLDGLGEGLKEMEFSASNPINVSLIGSNDPIPAGVYSVKSSGDIRATHGLLTVSYKSGTAVPGGGAMFVGFGEIYSNGIVPSSTFNILKCSGKNETWSVVGGLTDIRYSDVKSDNGDKLLKDELASMTGRLDELNNYDDSMIKNDIAVLSDKVDMIDSSVCIDFSERKVGSFNYGGNKYDLFEKSVKMDIGLIDKDETGVTEVVLSENPLGRDLYIKVEAIVVSASGTFMPDVFDIQKIYINDKRDTVLQLACKRTVSETITNAFVTVRYVKDMISYKNLSLSIPVSDLGITSANDIDVSFAPLKYDKKFVLSWTTDDALLCIYSYMHKYINGKYIDDTYNYHDWMAPTTGFTPSRVLCSTDGCGNDVRFRVDSAWVSYNNNISDGIHSDKNAFLYVSWPEMVTFLDFFNTAMNHGGGDESKPLESMRMCGDRLLEKTGYYPFLLLIPGGKTGYQEAVESLDSLYHYSIKENLNYSTDTITSDSFKSKTGLLCRKTYDGMSFEQLCSYIDVQATRNDHPYVYMGGHLVSDTNERIKWTDAVKPFLDYLHDTYGKGGSDSIWFAGPEEVYEYLFTRTYSMTDKRVVDGNLVVNLKVAEMPAFKRFDCTLLLSKVAGFTALPAVTAGDGVMKLSKGLKDGKILLNVNYNRNLLNLAEKYTSIWEGSQTVSAKEDALYFAGMLSDSLRQPFDERINAQEVAPEITSFTINSGDEVTYEGNVTINLTVKGNYTHYRIAEESDDFTGCEWIEKTGDITYGLSGLYGAKNVYIQVKNQYGNSVTANATIVYAERPVGTHTVTARSNNTDYGTVSPASQSVADGGTATVTATAKTGCVIESWANVSSSTGTGSSSGTASVINVTADRSVVCNFKTIPQTNKRKAVISSGWQQDEAGLDAATGICKMRNIAGMKDIRATDSSVLGQIGFDKMTVVGSPTNNNCGAVTGDDSGAYPDIYLAHFISSFSQTIENKGIISMLLGTGSYKIRVLASITNGSRVGNYTYDVDGVVRNVDIVNNLTEWMEWDVVSDGITKIVLTANPGDFVNKVNTYAPVNIIEILEL